MRFIEDLDVKGKTVLVRVDFNVPLTDRSEIRNDTRIKASLPTINHLIGRGAKLVLVSHLGRPKGKADPKLSLRPAAVRLAELIGREVAFAPDCIGPEVEALKAGLKDGQVLLLENVRFHTEETKNESGFCAQLAKGIEIFVNDAFSSSHRAHASVVGITEFIPVCAAGYLLKAEVDYLRKAVINPAKPYIVILGGAKVEDKIPVIENLVRLADVILIGGAMAYTFLKAKGCDVGRSLVEPDKTDIAANIMKTAQAQGVRLLLPIDHVLAASIESGAISETVDGCPFPADLMGVDIGPKTVAAYAGILAGAKTIIWNGPLGVFEMPAFAQGTIKIAQAVAASSALTIIGGGDSIAAVEKAGVSAKITHISTGGGASLEFLSFNTLPGIEALEKK